MNQSSMQIRTAVVTEPERVMSRRSIAGRAALAAGTLAMTAVSGSAARTDMQAGATPSPTASRPGDGLIVLRSTHDVVETIDRLEAALTEQGLIIVARIDHAANAGSVGKELRPTQLLLFGNPALGTELMLTEQTIGIDLPQKFLAWEDETGQVFLAYNDPAYLAKRHDIAEQQEPLDRITKALAMFAERATAP